LARRTSRFLLTLKSCVVSSLSTSDLPVGSSFKSSPKSSFFSINPGLAHLDILPPENDRDKIEQDVLDD